MTNVWTDMALCQDCEKERAMAKLNCEGCGAERNVRLRVFGSAGSVRIAFQCHDCHQISAPPEYSVVDHFTIHDIANLIESIMRRSDG